MDNFFQRARRLRVLNFFRQYDLPTHLQNEVSNNLELEYVSKSEPSEEHGIFKSLPRPIREMILNYLYNIYVTDSYLFKEVSDAVRFQLVTTILHNCLLLYFIYSGSLYFFYSISKRYNRWNLLFSGPIQRWFYKMSPQLVFILLFVVWW